MRIKIKINHSPCPQEAGRPQERADEEGLQATGGSFTVTLTFTEGGRLVAGSWSRVAGGLRGRSEMGYGSEMRIRMKMKIARQGRTLF